MPVRTKRRLIQSEFSVTRRPPPRIIDLDQFIEKRVTARLCAQLNRLGNSGVGIAIMAGSRAKLGVEIGLERDGVVVGAIASAVDERQVSLAGEFH